MREDAHHVRHVGPEVLYQTARRSSSRERVHRCGECACPLVRATARIVVGAYEVLAEPRLPVVRMLGREESDLMPGLFQEPGGLGQDHLAATHAAEELVRQKNPHRRPTSPRHGRRMRS